MIPARAAKRFSLDGKLYHKGDSVQLPDGQFFDLSAIGLVERVAVAPPARLASRIAVATETTPRGRIRRKRLPTPRQ